VPECAFCKTPKSEFRRLTLFKGTYVCEVCADAIAMSFGRPVPRMVRSRDSQAGVEGRVQGLQEESEP
jgi:hypothetical protein